MIQQGMQEPCERFDLIRVEVLELIDADDERLLAHEGQMCECQQDLLDLVVVNHHSRLGVFDLQSKGPGDLRVDLVAGQPGDRIGRQPPPSRIVGLLRSGVTEELK